MYESTCVRDMPHRAGRYAGFKRTLTIVMRGRILAIVMRGPTLTIVMRGRTLTIVMRGRTLTVVMRGRTVLFWQCLTWQVWLSHAWTYCLWSLLYMSGHIVSGLLYFLSYLHYENSISGWASMNFLNMSCFFCSSDVGRPISDYRWLHIIFST